MTHDPRPSRRSCALQIKIAAISLAALAAASCGSTISLSQARQGADGLTAAGGTGQQIPSSGVNAVGTGRPISGTAQTSPGLGSAITPNGQIGVAGKDLKPAANGPQAAAVPGRVSIGINVWDQSSGNAEATAFGSSQAIGDGIAAAKAVVRYVNGAGGIGGRQVVPIFTSFVSTSTQPWAVQRQAECSTFTQDHRVFAVVDAVDVMTDQMATCLAQRRTIYVLPFSREMLGDALIKSLYPYVYQPADFSDSAYAAAVDQIVAAGYFTPGYKLGVLTLDDAPYQNVYQHVVLPRLRAHGIVVTREATMPRPTSLADAGPDGQAASSAVLQFRSAGIDHVLFLTEGLGPLFFTTAAENQQYRPRYAMTSKESVVLNGSVAPSAQWHGALVAGWMPTQDVQSAQDPNDSSSRRLCLSVIRKAGVTIPGRSAEHYFMAICDGLLFLKSALKDSSSLDPLHFRQAVSSLGTSYTSAMTFSTDFNGQRASGANGLRVARFDDNCRCFVYAGAEKLVGS